MECNLLMLTMLRGGTEKKNDSVLEVRRRTIVCWKLEEDDSVVDVTRRTIACWKFEEE